MAESSVSLKPSEMVAGGLLDDVLLEWVKCRFTTFDYQGKGPPTPAFTLEGLNVDTGEEAGDNWSMGSPKDWEPSSDGKTLVPVGSATTLKNNSKGALLLTSLINAGFPEDKIEDDISIFEGMIAHMMRVPAPKGWSGLAGGAVDDAGKPREKTVLVVDEIIKLPWEKKKAAGAPAGAGKKAGGGKKKAAPKADTDDSAGADDLDTICTEFVMSTIVAAGDDGVAKKELTKLAFQEFKGHELQNQIVQRVFKDEFLDAGPWAVKDGIVSMGE